MDDKHGEILRQYDLKVYNMYRARGAFLLDTNQGLKLLKSFEGSKNHLIYENRIKEALQSSGYFNVDGLVPTRAGEFTSEDSLGGVFVVKDWFPGEECNLKDVKEVYQASRNLALLHNGMKNIELETEEFYVYQNPFDEVFVKHNRELKRVKTYIWDKKQRNEFELAFLQAFDGFYEEAVAATELMKSSAYKKLFEDAKNLHTTCHGNYTYHNILIAKEELATTNFEKACVGVQVTDLYQFLRKCMEKTDWEETFGKAIIDGYNSVRTLSQDEMYIIYILLRYPEKFWKVTNFYFNNKKSWISKRNIQKIESLQQQSPMKAAYLEKQFSGVY